MGSDEKDPWTEFLEELVARPGWSVSRLSRESGIDRGTIHRWLSGRIKTVKVDSVRMIAKGGQASLAAALHAARAHTMTEPVDSPDEDDPEIQRIRESTISDAKKADLIAHVMRRKAQLREEVDMLIRTSQPEHKPS